MTSELRNNLNLPTKNASLFQHLLVFVNALKNSVLRLWKPLLTKLLFLIVVSDGVLCRPWWLHVLEYMPLSLLKQRCSSTQCVPSACASCELVLALNSDHGLITYYLEPKFVLHSFVIFFAMQKERVFYAIVAKPSTAAFTCIPKYLPKLVALMIVFDRNTLWLFSLSMLKIMGSLTPREEAAQLTNVPCTCLLI